MSASLIAKVEVAIEGLNKECSCSRDCDHERAYARMVLDLIRVNIELLQALSGVEIPGDGKPTLPTP